MFAGLLSSYYCGKMGSIVARVLTAFGNSSLIQNDHTGRFYPVALRKKLWTFRQVTPMRVHYKFWNGHSSDKCEAWSWKLRCCRSFQHRVMNALLTICISLIRSLLTFTVRRVQPTRCDVSQFIYFCKTLYMFQRVFPSVIRSSKLHIQLGDWAPR